MSNKVYIVGAKRSPIGSFLGTLKDLHPAEIGVQVLKQLFIESKIPRDQIDEVIVGNVIQAGLGQNVARQIAIKSGVPQEVPAYTVNMVCGSGMKTVMNAYVSIKAGMSNLVVAGGVESMSYAPYLVDAKIRSGNKMGNLEMKDSILKDALHDSFTEGMHMGITAENIASKHGLSREALDQFAYESQQKAIKAVDEGRFKDEIVPIEIKTRKETIIFDQDEYPNRQTSLEKMAKLRPAFKSDGLVTAGSSSGINDGASFVILASESAVKAHN
ncbi:MAG: acetyl-CoA C-acyltransferase, partial [Acholeplasmataceae bacterium]